MSNVRWWLSLSHFFRALSEPDAKYCCTKDDREERAECHRESRKGSKDSKNTEKDECACAGHRLSISGLYDDDKLAADGVGVRGKMREHFFRGAGNNLFMYLGQLARDNDVRHLVLNKFL